MTYMFILNRVKPPTLSSDISNEKGPSTFLLAGPFTLFNLLIAPLYVLGLIYSSIEAFIINPLTFLYSWRPTQSDASGRFYFPEISVHIE